MIKGIFLPAENGSQKFVRSYFDEVCMLCAFSCQEKALLS